MKEKPIVFSIYNVAHVVSLKEAERIVDELQNALENLFPSEDANWEEDIELPGEVQEDEYSVSQLEPDDEDDARLELSLNDDGEVEWPW